MTNRWIQSVLGALFMGLFFSVSVAESIPPTMLPVASNASLEGYFVSRWGEYLLWSEKTHNGRYELNCKFLNKDLHLDDAIWYDPREKSNSGEIAKAFMPSSSSLYYSLNLSRSPNVLDRDAHQDLMNFSVFPYLNARYYRENLRESDGVWYANWAPNVFFGERPRTPRPLGRKPADMSLAAWLRENDGPDDVDADEGDWVFSWIAFLKEAFGHGSDFSADLAFGLPKVVSKNNWTLESIKGYRGVESDMVFVPSAEGLLHAFVLDGKEHAFRGVWSFMPPPSFLWSFYHEFLERQGRETYPRLPLLSGPFVVGDVEDLSGKWHRVLIGTTGPGLDLGVQERPRSFADYGAQEVSFLEQEEEPVDKGLSAGLYALDVSDVDSPGLLWSVVNDAWHSADLARLGRLSLFGGLASREEPSLYLYRDGSVPSFLAVDWEDDAAEADQWRSFEKGAGGEVSPPGAGAYRALSHLLSQPVLGYVDGKDGKRTWSLILGSGSAAGALPSGWSRLSEARKEVYRKELCPVFFDVDPLSGAIADRHDLEEPVLRGDSSMVDRFVVIRPPAKDVQGNYVVDATSRGVQAEITPKMDSMLIHVANSAFYYYEFAEKQLIRIFYFKNEKKNNRSTFFSLFNPDVAYFSLNGQVERWVASVLSDFTCSTVDGIDVAQGNTGKYVLSLFNLDRALSARGSGDHCIKLGSSDRLDNDNHPSVTNLTLEGESIGWFFPLYLNKHGEWMKPLSSPVFYGGNILFTTTYGSGSALFVMPFDVSKATSAGNNTGLSEFFPEWGEGVTYFESDKKFLKGFSVRDGVVYIPTTEGVIAADLGGVLPLSDSGEGEGAGEKVRYWRITR
ncbi:hypothetical protein KAR29_07565 [Aminithiophilus ramosus]|uniref:Uncharacterized protein n=2 Tax=Synergistales TaxID=649776 RepID=A0A9Q7AKM2_9BACT|nr:hypothetical protein [Aminithiophilus ramosus]QTX31258.1 hypothetical protein KAR29_07565 [Aminithiophilus ramosus]QVL35058.1 hypothetical protein KIH16_07410 [Synergistota bacterium]